MNTIKLKLLGLLIGLSLNYTAIAQNQNNQWRFGSNGTIDFNTVPPSSPGNSLILTGEGSASIADRNTGALLFYTDGIRIWNANNQVMPNGSGLLGGDQLSSTTAAVIIPKPFDNNLYYVVTIDQQFTNNGVRYSVVDMTLNGGLGDIVSGQKNIPLYSTNSEKLHVVPTSDGCGYWLITYNMSSSSFVSFRIDANGINTSPVVSTVGSSQGNGAGHIKVNRQFNKLAIGNLFGALIELFDFNNATGVVSNPITWSYTLSNSSVFYGIEFSPDGSKLYVSNLERIVQYDITQPTAALIQASTYDVSAGLSFYSAAALQLGPDNKIYVASGGIDAINAPNNAGAACDFQQNAITLNNGNSGYGLPQWIYYNDVPTATISYADTCITNGTDFNLQSTASVLSVNWNFDDPTSGANNTATGSNASHTFSQIGNYTIQAIVTYECFTDTVTQAIDIINCTTCTGTIAAVDTCLQAGTAFSISSDAAINSITWNFDDAASGTNNSSTLVAPSHTFSAIGNYNITASVNAACGTFTVNYPISIIDCSVPLCTGSISLSDSCFNSTSNFSINSNSPVNSVSWNFGDNNSSSNTSTSINASHDFSATGNYTVQAIVNFDCGADTLTRNVTINNCNCKLVIANAFTPNGDGTNESFGPIIECPLEDYTLRIFNRWGELIFFTDDVNERWNGRYQGVYSAMDVYVYLIQYKFPFQPAEIKNGSFTLLR